MELAFIAYTRRDLHLVHPLVRDLEPLIDGKLWFAVRDIIPTRDVQSQVRRAIDTCTAFVYCATSRTGLDIGYLAEEAAQAVARPRIKLFSALLEKDARVPPILGDVTQFDVSDKSSWQHSVQRLAYA